jgi:hypothetical protein
MKGKSVTNRVLGAAFSSAFPRLCYRTSPDLWYNSGAEINLGSRKRELGEKSKDPRNWLALGLLLGAAVGVAIGSALDNMAIGVGAGARSGVALGAGLSQTRKQ